MTTEAEWAWVAGVLEGEGCFSIVRRVNQGLYGQIKVSMTDRDVLEMIQEHTGIGTISLTAKVLNGRKPLYTYQVGKAKDVQTVLTHVMPWLGYRRLAKATELLHVVQSRIEIMARRAA